MPERDILIFSLAALGVLLLIANLIVALRLLGQLRTVRVQEQQWQKWLTKEVSLHGPTKAAIAAVLAMPKDRPLDIEEFQQEVMKLQDQWETIEDLAEQACVRLADLLEEEPAPK